MGFVLASACWAQLTRRVSFGPDGAQGNQSSSGATISPDGRYVAFFSHADNLVRGDTNDRVDCFVHDRQSGVTERLSLGSGGEQGNKDSYGLFITADGRYATFWSTSWTLVPGDTNLRGDVFVRDRMTGTTTRASIASDGTQGNGSSQIGATSSDGRYVVFGSDATNLVPGDTNGMTDVFLHDRSTGATTRLSLASNGAQSNAYCHFIGSISPDARFVVFYGAATSLVPGDTNGFGDVFVHDRSSGETTRVSLSDGEDQGNEQSWAGCISDDGRYVGFGSRASNLVPGDTNGVNDAFVRDRLLGTTVRVSVGPGGVQANDQSEHALISADGRYAVFGSWATNLAPGDTNGFDNVFLRDLHGGTTSLVTIATDGGPGNGWSSSFAMVSADGRCVAFQSSATNLVPEGANGANQIYVRDRRASGFTSLCDPGAEGVIVCPCSNPPSGRGRGCDNAAASGGAVLSASGIAYLGSDELVFATRDENPGAVSLLLQGNGSVAGGVAFGRGVRCVGGTILRRLFTSVASNGSITVPDLAGGDPTVSQRSAALGDIIEPGESRWYAVYYRDPGLTPGCPATSTFNTTQTGRIDWSL